MLKVIVLILNFALMPKSILNIFCSQRGNRKDKYKNCVIITINLLNTNLHSSKQLTYFESFKNLLYESLLIIYLIKKTIFCESDTTTNVKYQNYKYFKKKIIKTPQFELPKIYEVHRKRSYLIRSPYAARVGHLLIGAIGRFMLRPLMSFTFATFHYHICIVCTAAHADGQICIRLPLYANGRITIIRR